MKKFISAILIINIFILLLVLKIFIEVHTIKCPEITIIEANDLDFKFSSPEEGLIEAMEYYNIKHADIVYAQAILETGYFKSKLCKENNNLFGLYNSRTKQYYKFKYWWESVLAYKQMVQYRYKSSEDYYNFLHRIGYAEDKEYINKLKKIVKRNEQKRITK